MRKPFNRAILFVLAAILVAASCKNKQESEPINGTTSADTVKVKNYFPVLDFLRGELTKVDSLPGGILQLERIGSKVDSSYINAARVHQLADQFLTDELAKANFEEKFEETSFFDNSTQTSTFTYAASDPSVAVRRVDVISQSGAAYDKVLSIYMEKSLQQNDTTVVRKIQWLPGKQFQLVSEKRLNNGPISNQLTTVIWDSWSGSE